MLQYGEESRLAIQNEIPIQIYLQVTLILSKHCNSPMNIKAYDFGFRVGRTTSWHGIQRNTVVSKYCMFHPIRFGFRILVSGDFSIFCIFLPTPSEKKTGSRQGLQAYRRCEKLEIRIFYHISLYITCYVVQFEDNKDRGFQIKSRKAIFKWSWKKCDKNIERNNH